MTTLKSIFIPDEIIIVQNKAEQGYVVLPDKPNMLESALRWAKEYTYDYSTEDRKATLHEGTVHKYKNGQFKLKLCESAANSWNGGKLSFWNCIIVAPDKKEFLIGINQELLCNLLQNCTLVNGEVQQLVWLGKQRNNTGVYTELMPDFAQAKDELKVKATFKSKTTTYNVGDIVGSPNKLSVYAGPVYSHYAMETTYDYGIHSYVVDVEKLDKPEKYHLFVPYEDDELVPDWTFSDNIKRKKTPYTVVGHLDYTAEELYQLVLNSKRGSVLSNYSSSIDNAPSIEDVQESLLNYRHYGTSKFIVRIKYNK